MTERLLSTTTQIATPIQTAFSSTASITANDALPVAESVDEEPYTIKCICDYSDDDGNTIYCETCDTWQHIECFYPGRVDDAAREEFDHSCADCKPRPLDRRHATERQRHQRQNKATHDSGEKKTKRPPSKSHKKKSKPSELQVNGYHHDHDGHKNGSPQDFPSHTKKAKGHRLNQSISSQVKRSPPYSARPHTHAHPPSPARTPPDLPNNFQVHSYSDIFLALYNDDQNAQTVQINSFASLSVTNDMALWLQDSEKLRLDAGVKDKQDVFQNLLVSVDTLKWPELRIEKKASTINDAVLQWQYLVTPTQLNQPGGIGELNGLINFQKDYCDNADNRWQESIHPRPFIFFHPRLPIYIDTRREGSICRYVRRSCRANSTLETYIASGYEYHFWLVSERSLAANEQITLPWDFRFPAHLRSRYLHLLDLGDEDGAQIDGADLSEEEYETLSNMIHLVLSDYGGCACDLGCDCAFARFHRNYHGRSHAHSNGIKSKKGRKPKQQHASPTSTGHATNSRAASEGQQELYDAEDDSRSASGSIRSKPQSRDLTPFHGVGETNGILTEPSDREKRKLAMLEDSFRKMEQGQPPRKKKRASDGSNINLPGTLPTPQQPTPKPKQKSAARTSISRPSTSNGNGSRVRQYADASTSRQQSGSPFSAISPTAALPSPQNPASRRESLAIHSRQASMAPKNNYSDSSTQTDPDQNTWYSSRREGPSPKRPIVSLSKRLLDNRHNIRMKRERGRTEQMAALTNSIEDPNNVRASPSVSVMDLDVPQVQEHGPVGSPTDVKDRKASIASSTPPVDVSSTSVDVNMSDAPTASVANAIKPPPPWPGQSNTGPGTSLPAAGHRSDLRVQMPLTPSFNTSFNTSQGMSGTFSGSVTPSSAAGSIAQSPFGTMYHPAPFSPSVGNGASQHPSPVKATKKLSLSDYKARLKRSDTSATGKPSTGASLTLTIAVLKPSLSIVEEAKASGVLEGSAIVDSPMVEKTTDPMTAIGPEAADTSKHNLPSEPNGTL